MKEQKDNKVKIRSWNYYDIHNKSVGQLIAELQCLPSTAQIRVTSLDTGLDFYQPVELPSQDYSELIALNEIANGMPSWLVKFFSFKSNRCG